MESTIEAEFDDEAALMSVGLRCCDVYQCPKPAVIIEADTDGARIFVCEDHLED